MIRYDLAAADRRGIEQVISNLAGLGLPADEPALLEAAVVAAHELPRPLREQLVALRLRELTSTLLVSGFAVDDNELGPTPGHWRDVPSGPLTRPEAYLLLVGSLLGDAFGWSTQQDGRIIHNVLPIKGHERQQVSSNSAVTLSWHTEDGFCAYRPDYVVLLCLRNPDHAVTRYADVSRLPIPAADRELLSEPLYRIRSDYSHRPAQNLADPAKQATFELVHSYTELLPILSGDLSDPVVRLDADFLDPPANPRHAAALRRLCELVESSLEDLVLAAGELLIIDNFRAVHGRAPFAARFDGTDRWLKRMYITRDLRRSRPMRRGITGRLLFA